MRNTGIVGSLKPVISTSIVSALVILLFLSAGCANTAAVVTQPPSSTSLPTTISTDTAVAVPTSESIESSSDFNVDDLIPMYKVGNTAELTQADMLPELDITSNAETLMREARFGGQLDLVIKFIYKYLNKDTSINEHTFQPVFALNPYSDPPVYTAFIYDRQADCLRYPYFNKTAGQDDPDANGVIYAHSGDVTEIMDLAEASSAFIYYTCLTPPVGLGDGVETRLIATKTGIVPGAFYNQDLFVGWFDFDRKMWHLTEEAKGWLKILNASSNLQDNLSNWLSGDTVIAESDIFDSGSRSRKFNIFDPAFRIESGLPSYYGVLLGTEVISDQLFIFFGFEDVNSTRYYLPFNLGRAEDAGCAVQLIAVSSNTGQRHRNSGDQTSAYQCTDLAQVIGIFANKPMAITQLVEDSFGIIPADQSAEFETQQEYALSTAQYIYNSAYSAIGNNTLDGRVNASPESINPSDYPRAYLVQLLVRKVDY